MPISAAEYAAHFLLCFCFGFATYGALIMRTGGF